MGKNNKNSSTGNFSKKGRGQGVGIFRKSKPNDPRVRSEVQIFVEGLPKNCKVPELVQYFSSVGEIKIDRETKKPRIWLYKDKVSGQQTGEATITYTSPATQKVSLQTYHDKMFQGHRISVTPSIVKSHMATIPDLCRNSARRRGSADGRNKSGQGRRNCSQNDVNSLGRKNKAKNVISQLSKFHKTMPEKKSAVFVSHFNSYTQNQPVPLMEMNLNMGDNTKIHPTPYMHRNTMAQSSRAIYHQPVLPPLMDMNFNGSLHAHSYSMRSNQPAPLMGMNPRNQQFVNNSTGFNSFNYF